jgi:ATP-dependent RNA helicase DHX37/DHR1
LDEDQPETDDELDSRELGNITSESVAEKERRKLVRKKYYSSQMVKYILRF